MRPVSSSFLSTVRGAHKAVFRARICAPGQTGTNPTGAEIPVLGGDVTFDTTADVNATLDLTTQYTWPLAATAFGTPYGSEVFVERGVQYGNGIKEYVGLGYFRIDSVGQARTPNGAIRIQGTDRMSSVRDGRNLQPIQFSAGASFRAVVDFVLGDVVTGFSAGIYDFPDTNLTASHILGEDRLQFLKDLLTAYGKVGYFRYDGRFVVKTPPAPASTPVFTINHGKDGVLVSMSREINRDGVYNAVMATGEPVGETTPVFGIAYDLAVNSPTKWGGPFGKVPRLFSSSFIENQGQANSAAQSILTSSTGLPYVVSLGSVPNTALEGWDVVLVDYDGNSPDEFHVLDRITYPLSVSAVMAMDTRKQYL